MEKKVVIHGRKNVNKLDNLLVLACIIIAVGSIWLSIGIAANDLGGLSVAAFRDVALSLGFIANVEKYGQAAILSVYNSAVFYGSLLLLVIGTIYLFKKGKKEKVPGLVTEFVAAVGFVFFLSFVYEMLGGTMAGKISVAFPVIAIILMVCLAAIMAFAIYAVYSKYNVDLIPDEEVTVGKVYEDAAKEEKKPEPMKEEKKPEPVPEPEPVVEEEPEEEVEEDEVEESEEEDEFDSETNYKGLGARRRRIPFEKKLRKADAETKERYKIIADGLKEYDFNDRISIPGETFSYKREKLVFLTFSGKTLKVFLRLNAKEFEDSPIPLKDASGLKKYEETPAYLKIKSGLAARRVVSLVERIAEENSVPKK